MKFNWGQFKYLATAAGIGLLLAGCGGGGGGSPTSSTLGGTAAVGFPIVGGTINVRCAAGSAISPATTNSTGDWQVTVSGQTLPCAVQVSGGTINSVANTTSYHSIATALGTVNITPLTDLMVANLAGAATLGAWFDGLTPAMLTAINQTGVDAALAKLRTALSGLAPLGTINPITTAFTAAPGNTSDDMLAALRAAMTSASVTYATLLNNASATTFTVPAGFGTALTLAYQGMTGGGGTGTGGGSSSGNYTLTVSVTASGIASPTITISNVPKPADQTAFCGDVAVTSALTGAAAGGTLTINSCTFDGTSGSISATVNITTPVSATIPYTVNYTYAANAGGGGGGTGTISCDTTQYQTGAVRAPTAAELASYARTYSGSEGTYGPNPNDPFVASGPATLVFSTNGTATYNGTAITVSSLCLDITTSPSQLLYIMASDMSHFDLFGNGDIYGYTAAEKAVSPTPYTGATGTGSGTLPSGVASKLVTMTYCCSATGSPYVNGQQVLFTFSSSGGLFLTDKYNEVSKTFTVIPNSNSALQSEYQWIDATGAASGGSSFAGTKYTLALTNNEPAGEIFEVNINSAAGAFLGQFNTPVNYSTAK